MRPTSGNLLCSIENWREIYLSLLDVMDLLTDYSKLQLIGASLQNAGTKDIVKLTEIERDKF